MAQNYLNVLAYKVYRRVEGRLAEILVHKVEQAVLGFVFDSVEDKREAGLEVGVVLDHCFHIVKIVREVSEHQIVRGERDKGAVLGGCGFVAAFFKFSSLESCP